MERRSVAAWSAVACLLCARPSLAGHGSAGFGHGLTGPVITIPPETMPHGRWSVTTRFELVSFTALTDQALEDAAAAGDELHSVSGLLRPSLALAYGIHERFSLAVRVPYVQRDDIRAGHLHAGGPDVHALGDANGFGDMTLLALFRLTPAGDAPQAALLAGIKLPSGEFDVIGDDGLSFETEHQPGSGSTDALVGLAVSDRVAGTTLNADVLATLTGDGTDDTDLGTLGNYDAAVTFRMGREHGDGGAGDAHIAFDGVLEVNGEWRDKQTVAGVDDEHSGGNLVYLSPGLRAGVDGRWSASASVGIPVLQDLHGQQNETSLRVLVGLGFVF